LCAHSLGKGTGIHYSKRDPARISASSLKSNLWLWPIAQRFLANRDARLFKKKSKFAGGRILGHLRVPLGRPRQAANSAILPAHFTDSARAAFPVCNLSFVFFEFEREYSQALAARKTR